MTRRTLRGSSCTAPVNTWASRAEALTAAGIVRRVGLMLFLLCGRQLGGEWSVGAGRLRRVRLRIQ